MRLSYYVLAVLQKNIDEYWTYRNVSCEISSSKATIFVTRYFYHLLRLIEKFILSNVPLQNVRNFKISFTGNIHRLTGYKFVPKFSVGYIAASTTKHQIKESFFIQRIPYIP